jgi:hypothetical protein
VGDRAGDGAGEVVDRDSARDGDALGGGRGRWFGGGKACAECEDLSKGWQLESQFLTFEAARKGFAS